MRAPEWRWALETRFMADVVKGRLAQLGTPARTSEAARSPVVVNSLPKSGTHLLIRLLESLPGIHRVRLQLAPKALEKFEPDGQEPVVPVGVSSPVLFSRRRLLRVLSLMPSATFCTGHLLYSEPFADILAAVDMKMVLIIRDPRDVVVSSAGYLADQGSHRLHPQFGTRPLEERMLQSIRGIEPRFGDRGMLGIRERMRGVLAWDSRPEVYLTRFEPLVGPAGGGSRSVQVDEIRRIARHLGIGCSEQTLDSVASGLFGGTGTFRKGQIGAWREAFTPRLVDAAKPLLSDILVELGY
ncbi:MAG: sulfotransferase domain-containing protein, partial [Actinomycetota bacterium]|nr:sulfotransferase domain-containing protein [Actinomycetota bacterium]